MKQSPNTFIFFILLFVCFGFKQDIKNCEDSGLKIKHNSHLTGDRVPTFSSFNDKLFNISKAMFSILCKNDSTHLKKIQTLDSLLNQIQWTEISEDTLIARYPRDYIVERSYLQSYYKNRGAYQTDSTQYDYGYIRHIYKIKDSVNIDSTWIENHIRKLFCEVITNCTYKFEYFNKNGIQDSIFLGGRIKVWGKYYGYKFTKGKFYQTLDVENLNKLYKYMSIIKK